MAPVAVGTPQGAPGGGQSNLPQNVDPNDQRFRMVSPQTFNFGSGASGHPYKKGGAVKHPDEKMDIALIKKMVKPSARKGKNNGGGTDEGYIGPGGVGQEYNSQDQYAGPGGIAQESKGIQGRLNAKSDRDYAARRVAAEMDEADTRRKALDATIGHLPQSKDDAYEREHGRYSKWKAEHGITGLKKGGRAARKEGGGVFSGPGYPGKIPGVVPGGRDAHARGGKTRGKGKTNINIIVAAGQKPGMGMTPPGGPTPPPGMDQGPGAAPIPMPAQNPQATPMPMPMPIPIPMGGAGGAGAAPTARKSGGRLTKVAHSFKDMQAGAGSGEGRLQKTDIAKARMGRKAGGKTYRSYKDMDAGAGSGMGRLEKTEIQARKG
jgi:hypothetical protein